MTTSDDTSAVNLNGGSLSVTGDLTGTKGTISLGGGTLSVSGTTTGAASIDLGGGTANFGGAATIDGTKLTLTDGGTLNFNAASGASAANPTASTISGAVASTQDKALNINLGANTKVSFSDTTDGLNLKNATDTALDKITLGGGTLAVGKLTADATNLDTTRGGTIDFTGDGSTITNALTLGSGTTLKFSSTTNTNGTSFDSLTTNGGKLDFAQGTAKVKNLTANASDLTFSNTAGKLVLQNDGKTSISGALAMEQGEIVISAGGTTNELSLGSLSLTKTGKITLGGGVVNVSNGLNADDAAKQIILTEGGTINFNGGTSSIKGSGFTTTKGKAANFNVKGGSVNFDSLTFATGDTTSKLTLDSGTVNMGALTTVDAANLVLNGGTLNFTGTTDANGEVQTATSTIGVDWDLTTSKAAVNFNKGAVVNIKTNGAGTLTAANVNLNGGEVKLTKLTAATGEAYSGLANLNFAGGTRASVTGTLGDTAAFSIGTDADGNNFISKDSETAKISGANNALSLNSGTLYAFGELATDTTGKLIFNGGNLVVGEAGTLKIDDSATGLSVLKAGTLTLKGKADGSSGGAFTLSDGNLDLSSGLNISLDNGAKFTTTKASKISGTGQSIQLGKNAAISINGDVTTDTGGKFEAAKITGALELSNGTVLGISTAAVDGVYKELETGAIKAAANGTATLAFGNGGAVSISQSTATAGGVDATKFTNQGFAGAVELQSGATLNVNRGVVNFAGALGTAANATNTLFKVSNATANLQGGFDSTNAIKAIELSGGTLNITGDYAAATGTAITTDTNSKLNVSGAVTNAQNITFSLIDAAAGSYTLLSSGKGVTGAAKAELKTRTSLQSILDKYGLTLAATTDEADKIVTKENREKDQDVKIGDGTVDINGKDIVVTVTSLESKDTTTLQGYKAGKDTEGMATAIKVLETLESDNNFYQSGKQTDFQKVKTALTTQQTNAKDAATKTSNAEAARDITGGSVDGDILLSAFGNTGGTAAREKVGDKTLGEVLLTDYANGGALINDIKDSAATAQNTASPTASVTTTMTLATDMAIGGRIAAARNPYANYASIEGLAGLKFAQLKSDLPAYYSNNDYMNGFWGNLFGGLNRIDGESGGLFGASFGFDKQFESALLGFYLSYAKANLNDQLVSQNSHNAQVGLYVSFNQRDIELNAKIYGQTAVTEQERISGSAGVANADFVRQFAGITANVGKIFAFNNNKSFIKPFLGENYYYTYTPAYTESGSLALQTSSINTHAFSIDVGVDYRQYLGENSFFYLTPKVERYIINNGGDFTAGFIGSDAVFSIPGKSRDKTYAQVLVGGNIEITKKLNVNLGLGFRKILTGEVEKANGDLVDEMYLNGNLGVKYRF